MTDARRFAPATTRNREPILTVLERVVPAGAKVLEIASGTGEHAVFFAGRLPVSRWQPTDPDATSRASIDAWRVADGVDATRVEPALALDVIEATWPVVAPVDVVVCINMIHIAPWAACVALLQRAADIVRDEGVLFLYGPFRRDGAHTAPSNEAFDRSLRERDPRWGIRDLERVVEVAARDGFGLEEVVDMPANNLSVVFRRGVRGAG